MVLLSLPWWRCFSRSHPKEYQNDVEKGCTRRLKTGPPKKCGKCEFDMLFAMFCLCGAPLDKYLSGSFGVSELGPNTGFEKDPSKTHPWRLRWSAWGFRDDFWVSIGVPFATKNGQNRVLACMPLPKAAPRWPQDGPTVAQDHQIECPRVTQGFQIESKWHSPSITKVSTNQ